MILRETRKVLVLKVAHGALIGLKVSGGTATKENAGPDDVTDTLDPPGNSVASGVPPKAFAWSDHVSWSSGSITETRHIQHMQIAPYHETLDSPNRLLFPSQPKQNSRLGSHFFPFRV
jgi:hypothetical protein